jgi:vacuolar-type H+-ATPase subunit H
MVRQAERKSEEVVSAANNEANQIISDAKKTAASMIADGARSSESKTEQAVAAAHEANRALMDEFSAELEAEVRALKASAAEKTGEAVELVYRSFGSH